MRILATTPFVGALLATPVLALALAPAALAGEGCSGSATAAATLHSEKNIVETAVAASDFKTLAAALKAADLVDALQGDGPFTVFAPTDAAFARLPKGALEGLLAPKAKGTLQDILKYHVVAGAIPAKSVVGQTFATTLNGQRLDIRVVEGSVMIDNATVVKTDIICSNGVIHVIDAVVMPSTKSIVETAVGAGQFNTLVAAVKAAGLAETLMGPGPFTVFAPTDEAFAKLPAGTVESLLKPENLDKLQTILKLHVVSGRVYADQALKAGEATTLTGRVLPIRTVDGAAMVGGAKIVGTDVESSNGVIHVIDTVLLPQ